MLLRALGLSFWVTVFLSAVVAQIAYAAGFPPQATAPTLLGPGGAYEAGYIFLLSALLGTLFGGAFIVINFGLMSKRPHDHVGEQTTPSDVQILSGQLWQNDTYYERTLPAADNDEGAYVELREHYLEKRVKELASKNAS